MTITLKGPLWASSQVIRTTNIILCFLCYTGFIPKSQHYFGKRYAENSVNAISDFEGNQQSHKKMIKDLQVTEALQSGRRMGDRNNADLPVGII